MLLKVQFKLKKANLQCTLCHLAASKFRGSPIFCTHFYSATCREFFLQFFQQYLLTFICRTSYIETIGNPFRKMKEQPAICCVCRIACTVKLNVGLLFFLYCKLYCRQQHSPQITHKRHFFRKQLLFPCGFHQKAVQRAVQKNRKKSRCTAA